MCSSRWPVCIGSIVATCALCSSGYFEGNYLTNRSSADLGSGKCHNYWRFLWPLSPPALVSAYIQCTTCICKFSSRHLQILWNSKWITLLGFAEKPVMNHVHPDSTSKDFLLWLQGPLGSTHTFWRKLQPPAFVYGHRRITLPLCMTHVSV